MSDNSGPAFPTEVMGESRGEHHITDAMWQAHGMSLRDYFAAKALAGLALPVSLMHDNQHGYDRIAEHTFKMADAMLRAKSK